MVSFAELFLMQHRASPEKPALTVHGETYSFDDLRLLYVEQEQKLRSMYGEARADYLPLIVDGSIESHVAIITCLLNDIPFGLVDGHAPPERIEALLLLLGNPRRGWWGPDVSHDAIPPVWEEGDTSAVSGRLARDGQEGSGPRFVVTTSGSTGMPKGVVLDFGRLLDGIAQFQQDEVMVKNPSISSFGPLHFIGGLNRLSRIFAGQHVHVFDAKEIPVGEILPILRNSRITHLYLPPQIARLLASRLNPSDIFLDTVKYLRMGSEGIRFEVIHGLKRYLDPGVILLHGLGASESMGMIRGAHVLRDAPPTGQVPLGTAKDGTKFVPLAGDSSPVREVWASRNIAVGYLGQPKLTSERFVTDPSGKRFWRSGDLIEIADDEQIYHRGRVDDIVKVRGILASPSETTRILLDIPAVRAAVTLPHVKNGNTRLVSHVEFDENAVPMTPAELRSALERALPSHLLPQEIYLHQRLPTNPRGKIDRTALGRGWGQ